MLLDSRVPISDTILENDGRRIARDLGLTFRGWSAPGVLNLCGEDLNAFQVDIRAGLESIEDQVLSNMLMTMARS